MSDETDRLRRAAEATVSEISRLRVQLADATADLAAVNEENALFREDVANLIAVERQRDALQATADRYREALEACTSAMRMQVGRETGSLHIPQPTALCIWEEALAKADAALADTSPPAQPATRAACDGTGLNPRSAK